ncbi:arsenate reductase (glutaredoxin) [Lacinutrix salivirga]
MIQIYHNNRCSKSRNALKLVEDSKQEFEVIKYLENVPTKTELKHLIKLLGITPMELIRKNEAAWKDHFKGKTLTDAELIDAMISYPKLIERPIIVNNNIAIIGRPPEKVLDII